MKYIIMCGGTYQKWDKPRQLLEIRGEAIVARTIRLLQENGVDINDIFISSNDMQFGQFGVNVLVHNNPYNAKEYDDFTGYWVDGFYPTNEPTCYIFGDVVFSPYAIKTIVDTDTDDIEFFASAPPFSDLYNKKWAEPFALKVVNTEHLKNAISLTKQYQDQGLFKRKAIMWELWQVIQAAPLNKIDYNSYVKINDYTCDIDDPEEIEKFRALIPMTPKTKYMIHTMPKRAWYVEQYLVPSMVAQGIDPDNITIYNDTKQEGNLKAWIKACKMLPNDDEGTWHLQDDVIISSKFKYTTEAVDFGIVCGFKSMYDGEKPYGAVAFKESWWSFPCIRIPNKIARECAEWIERDMIGNPIYRDFWSNGVNDDYWFRQYIDTYYRTAQAINLKPNIVDHIDYLIGGTVNSNKRGMEVRAKFWDDEYLVTELAERLKRNG